MSDGTPLPNRSAETPVSGRDYPEDDPEGRRWSEIWRAAVEELNANALVSDLGANRTDYEPEDGTLFIPTDGGDWYLGTGTGWTNLGPVGDITDHTTDTTNPHEVTSDQVGSPSDTEFASHTGDQTNPHSVTATQADALPTSGGTVTGDTTFTTTTHDSIDTGELNTTTYVPAAEDGAGIAAAIASNAVIELEPGGEYVVDSTITLAEGVTILCRGEQPTLRATGDFDVLYYDGASATGDITLKNLHIDLDKATTASQSSGVFCQDSHTIQLRDVVVENTELRGVRFDRCLDIDLDGVIARNIGTVGGIRGSGIVTVGCSGVIRNCRVEDSVFGFNIQRMDATPQGATQLHMTLMGCQALRNNIGDIGTGFRVGGSADVPYGRGVRIIGCYSENSGQYDYMAYQNVIGTEFIGCVSVGANVQGFLDHGQEGQKVNHSTKFISCTAHAADGSGFRSMYSRDCLMRDCTVMPTHPSYTQVTNQAVYLGPDAKGMIVEDCLFRDRASYENDVVGGHEPGEIVARNNIGLSSQGRWGEMAASLFEITDSGTSTITFPIDGGIQMDEQGSASSSSEARIHNADLAFNPADKRRIRLDVENIAMTSVDTSRILVEVTDNPAGGMRQGADYLVGEVWGSGTIAAYTSNDGTETQVTDTTQDDLYVEALNYIELFWDGATLTVTVSDGTTDVVVSDGTNYPTANLYFKLAARDSSGSAARAVQYDVTDIRIIDS